MSESPLKILLGLFTCSNKTRADVVSSKDKVVRTRSQSSKSDETKMMISSHRTFKSPSDLRRTSSAENKRRGLRHNTVPIPHNASCSRDQCGSNKVGSHSAPITIPSRYRRERTCSHNRNDSPFFIPPHLIREDQEAHSLRERMRRERAHRHNELCLKYDAERNGTPCNTPTTPVSSTRHTVSMKELIQNPDTPCMCDVCLCETTPKAHTWG